MDGAMPGKRTLTEQLPSGDVGAMAPVATGGGEPLPAQAKATMERAFGADFSDVRIHQDSAASAMTAAAFTQGSHIHFAPGRYDPSSEAGLALLGHELTHVLQQRAGRVAGTQTKGDVLNTDASLEAEADHLGERAARGERVNVPGAGSANTSDGPQRTGVRQGYLLFNPAGGGAVGNTYNHAGGTTFEGQEKGVGALASSFMTAGGVPNINNGPAPALRISATGQLAIEDSDLTTRQPKHFFAAAASIAGWNQALEAAGSFYRIITVPAESVTFTLPGAPAATTLVKAQARNLVANNQGNAMTTEQYCDNTVEEVTGSSGSTIKAKLAAPLANPLPVANPAAQAAIQQYYVAAELAGVAAGGVAGGGMPVGGINFANAINPQLNAIAGNYGTAMHNHLNGAPDAALDGRMQHLGVNQYAAPRVGEGLVTHSLSRATPMPGPPPMAGPAPMQKQDEYNGRVLANAGNNNAWGFHWGGVVASDGGDYVTLENYARNAEDAVNGGGGADGRFYFQMYGGAGQSWHEAWSALNGAAVPGVREFTNPLTMAVKAEDSPAAFNNRATRNYGANYAGIKDDHPTVGAAATPDQLTIAALKGLAYANHHINATGTGHTFADWNRLRDWRAAIAAAVGAAGGGHWSAPVLPLLTHAQTALNQLSRNPFTKIKSWF